MAKTASIEHYTAETEAGDTRGIDRKAAGGEVVIETITFHDLFRRMRECVDETAGEPKGPKKDGGR